MSRNQSIALAAVVAIVALGAGALLSRAMLQREGSGSAIATAVATVVEPSRPLPEMGFVDQADAPFGNDRLRGHWSLMFFGFTSCPDVCPATLGMLAQTEKMLADLPQAQRPHVILVSVDPKRDTPEKLAAYVKFFSPSFTGITAPQEKVDAFTRQLGVPVAFTPVEGGYMVDHSAAIFLIDPEGAMRALFSAPHTPKLIAEDYRRIVKASGT